MTCRGLPEHCSARNGRYGKSPRLDCSPAPASRSGISGCTGLDRRSPSRDRRLRNAACRSVLCRLVCTDERCCGVYETGSGVLLTVIIEPGGDGRAIAIVQRVVVWISEADAGQEAQNPLLIERTHPACCGGV